MNATTGGPDATDHQDATDHPDADRVRELLGREPAGRYEVVVRDDSGDPVVIRNHPLLDDGAPMPTRYWLVGAEPRKAIDRLEAGGGVRQAEAEVDAVELQMAHDAYAKERDSQIPVGWDGPRPAGGVGGTRRGVKCLHAHYAWYLAGGDDPVGRWVARRLEGPSAAIDCGTNSVRLLIAVPGGETLERLNKITRLGQDVDRTRRLAGPAIERTLAVLRDYKAAMDHFGVEPSAGHTRMTATSAARDAANRDEFFDAAEAIVGVRPELLAGHEEGRLSFLGATSELDARSGPWLVVDIGGGSTELVIGPQGGPEDGPGDGPRGRPGDGPGGGPRAVRSLDVGCVRLTERFLAGDPPSADSLEAARGYVRGLLDRTLAELPELEGASAMVGLAGTISCLAAVDQQLGSYQRDKVHHYRLRRERVGEILDRLAPMTSAQRREVAGMEAQRADVIVGGAIVLDEVMRRFGFEECLTSEADILDGLILDGASSG